MCNDKRAFLKGTIQSTDITVKLGDSNTVHVSQRGVAVINNVKLQALFVPEFRISLLSVSQLDLLGYDTIISNGVCTILKDKEPVLLAPQVDGLYKIQHSRSGSAMVTTRSALKKIKTLPSQPSVSSNQQRTKIDFRKLS